MPTIQIREEQVTRYIMPLREGGSLPAIAEAEDGFKYVIKFRGSGQGVKTLIAELLGGEIARKLGLKVPEIIFADLNEAFGRTEPDEEIQDLLKASVGKNLGLHYLNGSKTFDPVVTEINPALASLIVWLDIFITNVDRTPKNTNMLWWQKELWLIDHGASFYFHHSWDRWLEKASNPFPLIKDHCLWPIASELIKMQDLAANVLDETFLNELVSSIPEEWLAVEDTPFSDSIEHRNAYKTYLHARFSAMSTIINVAIDAR